jgi:Zn-dependent M28 family amino/carboxypeptidase
MMKQVTSIATSLFAFAVSTLAIAAEPTAASLAYSPAVKAPLRTISGSSLLKHIKVLASDDFEGRSPGTKGEAMTVAYLQDQFIKMGLTPGNPDGSYVQKVPMIGATSTPALSYQIAGKNVALQFPEDFVAWSPRVQTEIHVDQSELVFVGYGIVAPEYGWDDYKGVDLRGKTMVMLINDPPVPDPKNPDKLDASMFKGEAMTYYGRWTYKYEIAAKMGAAAAIIVHETKPAAYPYEVVRNSNSRENFSLKTDGPNPNFPLVPGWIHLDKAKELFSAAGDDFDRLKKAALSKDFKPVSLGGTASIHVNNTWREVASNNVVAKIEGSDPKLKDEYVIYSAHWDHFGFDESLPGPKSQQVFHGALDNASGVATLLELAKAFKALKVPPKRSILFIATTAEERGLLGAQYYARHPLYPLKKTLADINIDGINPWGRTKDVEIVGFGHSTMDDIVTRYSLMQNRKAEPESRPELGGFYRADNFEFAKEGVPVVYAKSRNKYLDKPENYAREKVDQYISHDYHQVSDIVHDDWDMTGAVEDARMLFMVGYDVAQGKTYPQWKTGSEFKAKRDWMMKGAAQ